ncbi:hypothetical protein TMatcc_002393 [Talaromyces marneffei ATCC 18224]
MPSDSVVKSFLVASYSLNPSKSDSQHHLKMYKLPPLPYAYNALEPIISAQIMTLHHSKHHQTYINNLNAALSAQEAATVSNDISALPAIKQKIKFNGGGHINHSLLWRNLAPVGSAETDINAVAPTVKAAIEAKWGSISKFIEGFKQTLLGIQGSGWGWLIAKQDPAEMNSKTLDIVTSKDQDAVVTCDDSVVPLVGVDMWEHAYYLQYLNNKAGYVTEIWKIINWKVAEERFARGVQGEVSFKL